MQLSIETNNKILNISAHLNINVSETDKVGIMPKPVYLIMPFVI